MALNRFNRRFNGTKLSLTSLFVLVGVLALAGCSEERASVNFNGQDAQAQHSSNANNTMDVKQPVPKSEVKKPLVNTTTGMKIKIDENTSRNISNEAASETLNAGNDQTTEIPMTDQTNTSSFQPVD
jgi:hypothetical protein